MADDWIDAAAAAKLLGVKRETLYAYVSRELVRARPAPSGRKRLYQRADLERLKTRSRARAGHTAAAASAMRWGEPVLDSALTQIDEHGPYYRGRLALELARTHSFEAVAELLWTGVLPRTRPRFASAITVDPRTRRLRAALSREHGSLDALGLVLALAPEAGPCESESAAALVRHLASSLALARDEKLRGRSFAAESVAEALLIALGGSADPASLRAVNEALIVCADHELNPSSFAARVAASVGASLPRCTLAALATFSGPLHGGACGRIEQFVQQLARPEDAIRAVSDQLRSGGSVPGFGHVLYPAGDPRARPLLERARRLAPEASSVRTIMALIDAVALADGEYPTVDCGLVALCSALSLPSGAASCLFAIGRSAGWMAHAFEQRAQGFVMRPRARYAPNL